MNYPASNDLDKQVSLFAQLLLVETHSLFYFTFTETLQDAIIPILQILKLKLKEAKCPSFLCSFLL